MKLAQGPPPVPKEEEIPHSIPRFVHRVNTQIEGADSSRPVFRLNTAIIVGARELPPPLISPVS